MPSISIILPAYNEEKNVGQAIISAVEAMESLAADYEVIVVDDGSEDGTSEVVKKLMARHPRVKLIRHPANRGYGGALRSGFEAATKRLLFFTSSDNQYNVAEVARLLPFIEEADLVIGYRAHRSDPLIRRLFAWGWGLLVNLLFGYVARDVDCAFKLFRRGVLDRVPLASEGAMIDTELLVGARRKGLKTREVPVSHFPRLAGRQTGARLDVILRAFRDLASFRWRLWRGKRSQ
ncbi:MAG: glycosyltransferase family 2 protein [Chloroflexota bacterium]|nr:glycosyltransferase family 2 protein [Chloroflexota bacterium]